MSYLATNEPRVRVFSRFARDLATLSKCEERGVAAIITDWRGSQIYAIGINGGPRGGAQCLCKLGGKYSCVHAEANAIAKDRSQDEEKVMFLTLSPCPTCAALMINNGIREVYYLEDWKDTTGIAMLEAAGVTVNRVPLDDEAT